MDEKQNILIEADDCCAFKNQEEHSEAIRFFISKANKWNVFHFINDNNNEEIPEIALLNYRDAKWYAGRLVGEATFQYNDRKYKIKINPRFGSFHLFRMLEEVFNVQFSDSKTLLSRKDDFQYLIRKLISFLWLNLLSKANKHGLPKHNIKREHKGNTIRGRLNVKQSIKPLYTEKQLISNYREKILNETVTQILKQAQTVLLREYYLGSFNISANAKDAITQFSFAGITKEHISENEFKRIVYKDIYQSFKPVVDLSWDIIKRKNIGNQQNNEMKDSFSFFIDMAEIWELYLKSLLRNNLAKQGWVLRNEKLKAYENKDYQRNLIPDIVFQRNNEIIVLDAKYKRMQFDFFDYDRADFFQIHTYINYYHQDKKVIVGGLLYPISKEFDEARQKKNISDSLFSINLTSTKFLVDGIDLSFIKNKNTDEKLSTIQLKEREIQFIDRIKKITTENDYNQTNRT